MKWKQTIRIFFFFFFSFLIQVNLRHWFVYFMINPRGPEDAIIMIFMITQLNVLFWLLFQSFSDGNGYKIHCICMIAIVFVAISVAIPYLIYCKNYFHSSWFSFHCAFLILHIKAKSKYTSPMYHVFMYTYMRMLFCFVWGEYKSTKCERIKKRNSNVEAMRVFHVEIIKSM